jgi:uncharacterized protein (TIGR03435 family)
MRLIAVVLPLVMLVYGTVAAQAPKSFEVVSIRPWVRGTAPSRTSSRLTPTQFDLVSVSSLGLVERAFNVTRNQIIAAPDWTTSGSERFHIHAIVPPGTSERDIPDMLRTLLAERFGFKMHIEQRPTPVYELVTGPSGPTFPDVMPKDELRTVFTNDPGTRVVLDVVTGFPGDEARTIILSGGGGNRTITSQTSYASHGLPSRGGLQVDAERITMAEFIRLIEPTVDRPVFDKTGLTGIYQFKTLLPPRPISVELRIRLAERGDRLSTDPSGVDLSRSLEELGLKLEPTTSLMDFIVVDSFERPTPN